MPSLAVMCLQSLVYSAPNGAGSEECTSIRLQMTGFGCEGLNGLRVTELYLCTEYDCFGFR